MQLKNFHSFFYFFKKKIHNRSKKAIVKKSLFFTTKLFTLKNNGFLYLSFFFIKNTIRLNISLFFIIKSINNKNLFNFLEIKVKDKYISSKLYKISNLIFLYLNLIKKNVLIKYYTYFTKKLFKGYILTEYSKNFYLIKVNNIVLLSYLKFNLIKLNLIRNNKVNFYLNSILKFKTNLKLVLTTDSTSYIIKSFNELCTPQIKIIFRKPSYVTQILLNSFDEKINCISLLFGINSYRLRQLNSYLGNEVLNFIFFKKNILKFIILYLKNSKGTFFIDLHKNTIVVQTFKCKLVNFGYKGSTIKLLIKIIGINILIC
ncbi:hypothetical protein E5P55_00285 [Candidatus Pinguicoccus supinus]|uniref:Uncharacterized protein n=1 Tax=Candidatus Pinguicoccus supinus TaxID=2529394 RepID=A0A7T0BRJ5_9BACT|nr:hypothetical protein E5P55_00285 [Candidatus Pinguicoccus supinus]